jgi:hypothetical protein
MRQWKGSRLHTIAWIPALTHTPQLLLVAGNFQAVLNVCMLLFHQLLGIPRARILYLGLAASTRLLIGTDYRRHIGSNSLA